MSTVPDRDFDKLHRGEFISSIRASLTHFSNSDPPVKAVTAGCQLFNRLILQRSAAKMGR